MNILQEHPLGAEPAELYDCVTTTLCLESASKVNRQIDAVNICIVLRLTPRDDIVFNNQYYPQKKPLGKIKVAICNHKADWWGIFCQLGDLQLG